MYHKYSKSYERERMSTSDVLKVLNLRTFKTSRVTINPEIHQQVHTIIYFFFFTFDVQI